jgi:hypothetical protein
VHKAMTIAPHGTSSCARHLQNGVGWYRHRRQLGPDIATVLATHEVSLAIQSCTATALQEPLRLLLEALRAPEGLAADQIAELERNLALIQPESLAKDLGRPVFRD